MRSALPTDLRPDHPGLAYGAWARVGADGKVPDDERNAMLADPAVLAVPADYARAFDRWRSSFRAPGDRVFELVADGRLLLGHGNPSALDVGLTVHHTWGVPLIPGSALKGVLSHYVDAVYGPEKPGSLPWDQPDDERIRADYQGVTWAGPRIARGPGAIHRALFGAPEAEADREMREHGLDAGATAGAVVFHDALYVPADAPEDGADRPFAADVLTVHQKQYYDSTGETPPNDYDDPNPVGFLTVRPGARMLFALSGPPGWTELAERLLRDALASWGVGGKTSSGYGRLIEPSISVSVSEVRTPSVGDRVAATLLEERTKKGGWKAALVSSGRGGPVQNSAAVPADSSPGDTLDLIVAIANDREIAFRVPTAANEQRTAAPRKPARPGGGRRR